MTHTFITPSGDMFTGRILWAGAPDPHKFRKPVPEDYVAYKVDVDNVGIVWLDNYMMHQEFTGSAGIRLHWRCNAEAANRIQKQLKKKQYEDLSSESEVRS